MEDKAIKDVVVGREGGVDKEAADNKEGLPGVDDKGGVAHKEDVVGKEGMAGKEANFMDKKRLSEPKDYLNSLIEPQEKLFYA